MSNPTTRVRQALSDLAAGQPLVLTGSAVGDPDSYLLLAAEKATSASLTLMVRHSSGFICAAVTGKECDRLGLPPMAGTIPDPSRSNYTVAIDAIEDVGTGISASDRARTVRLLANPESTAEQFTRPGHIVPVRACNAGVLTHSGPAEVITDLTYLAGLQRAGVYAALVSERDPTGIADTTECREIANALHLNCISADDVKVYRRATELHVQSTFAVVRDSLFGPLSATGFHSEVTGCDYVAYRIGQPPHPRDAPLVHVHRESNLASHADSFDPHLHAVFAHISRNADGVVLVERNVNNLQTLTLTTDQQFSRREDRNADIAQILRALGISAARLFEPPADLPISLQKLGFGAERCVGVPDHQHQNRKTMTNSHTRSRALQGAVEHGDQRGRELGFPTANLHLDEGTSASTLVDGVWAGRCELPDGRSVMAAISIGRRSTFYGQVGTRLLEAHLLDFDEDLYELEVTVHLDHWIRGQTVFASKEELVTALEDDVRRTRALVEVNAARTESEQT